MLQLRCQQGFLPLESTCSSLPGDLLIDPLIIGQLIFPNTGLGEKGNEGPLFTGYNVSLLQDGKVLEIYCTTV